MRAQPFLQALATTAGYNHVTVAHLANNPNITGGWEVWLQVEIALAFLNPNVRRICTREQQYPSGNPAAPNITYNPAAVPPVGATAAAGARCDFLTQRGGGGVGQTDDTYVELKCINASQGAGAAANAMQRFNDDIDKLRRIHAFNNQIQGIALLATHDAPNNINIPFGVQAFVWDPTTQAPVVNVGNAPNGVGARFLLIAASV